MGVVKEMNRVQALAFLQQGTRTGKLATVRPDGRPHVVPIWFVVDGDEIVFNTWHTSVKARNLAVDSRASLVVDLEQPPYAFVMVDGVVTISDDLDVVVDIATQIGRRYMGEERAEEFGRRNGVAGELVVRMHIDRIVSQDDVAGYGE